MTSEIFFTLLSVLLGVLCVRFLRRYDIHEKEPLWAMLAVAVWGGAWGVILALSAYQALAWLGIGDVTRQLLPLLVIGPVEETAKLAALATSYPIIRKELDEPTDGLIYMACVAIGFSFIENYFYAINHPENQFLYALRLVICTPMHILFSAFMGLAFYQMIQRGSRWPLLLYAWLYGSLMHGIYDLAVMNGWAFWLVVIIAWLSYWWIMRWLGYTTAISPHRQSLGAFIAGQAEPPVKPGLECLHCGSTEEKPTYAQEKIVFQKCDQCSYFVIEKKQLFRLFRHYGAAFGRPGRRYRTADPGQQEYATLYAGNFISEKKKLAFFHLAELDPVLEQMNARVAQRHEQSRLFRRFLGR
jgi:RsiW-degrading membrane proteinase PrsW (M82 family)